VCVFCAAAKTDGTPNSALGSLAGFTMATPCPSQATRELSFHNFARQTHTHSLTHSARSRPQHFLHAHRMQACLCRKRAVSRHCCSRRRRRRSNTPPATQIRGRVLAGAAPHLSAGTTRLIIGRRLICDQMEVAAVGGADFGADSQTTTTTTTSTDEFQEAKRLCCNKRAAANE
jgi:hypothetical protein